MRAHPDASGRKLFEFIAPFDSPALRRALLIDAGPLDLVFKARDAQQTGWLSPLFSAEFYRWRYPDVKNAGLDCWHHYQAYGAAEGRQPHPLIDPDHLGQWMPDEPRRSVVDRYLIDPSTWWMETSPFSRVSRFLHEAEVQAGRVPVEQMLSSTDVDRWFAFQLLIIATDAADRDVAHWAAAAYLSSRGVGTLTTELTLWDQEAAPASEVVSLVPGFFAGRGGAELARMSDSVISPDGTVVRLSGSHVSSNAQAQPMDAPSVIVMVGPVGHSEADRLVEESPRGRAIAPVSPAQQVGFERLVTASARDDVTVLEYGRQVTSASTLIAVDSHPRPEAPATWRGEFVRTVFLLDPTRLAATDREDVARAVASGAEFGGSLSNSSIWGALLSRADLVVVTRDELDAVRILVEADRIRIIGAES